MADHRHEPAPPLPEYSNQEMLERARQYQAFLATRRTVREFAADPVPLEVIQECVRTAGRAPSGANMQPWHFEIVGDPEIKRKIRLAAEKEERAFYGGRASKEWLAALEPFATDDRKAFLEEAPWLIVIFEKRYGLDEDGEKIRYYYTKESVGLAAGFLITALHHVGLATLTHTPSPMQFLNQILERSGSEKPFLLLVAGRPAPGATVPRITRKDLGDISNSR